MTITTIIGCTNQPYNTTVYITQPCSADFSMLVISPQLRLAEHLTPLRAWCTSDVCLVGEIPTCSVPALERCDGLWSYNYHHGDNEYTPPPLLGRFSHARYSLHGWNILCGCQKNWRCKHFAPRTFRRRFISLGIGTPHLVVEQSSLENHPRGEGGDISRRIRYDGAYVSE